jgi:putative ABC transport system substrate-binding protein
MRRREFIAGLGGAAASSVTPRISRAQQRNALKRVAFIGGLGEDAVIFGQELARLGWVDGRNLRVDYRLDLSLLRGAPKIVGAAIVGGNPDVIVTAGTSLTELFKQLTDTIPIVFTNVTDPTAKGLVAGFAHPGGNVTGFSSLEFSFAGKWLSILKEFVPGIVDVMMLYDTANSNWQGYWPILESAAASLRVTVRPAPATETADVVCHIETLARDPGGGLIVLQTALTVGERRTIAALTARYRLPAIYPYKFFVTSGGLVSYGSDTDDLTRRAAQYVDRILKGEKPADLPVQAPTKFELVINTRVATALGIEVPPMLLALTDEVID